MKKFILGFILGAITFSAIGVFAASTVNAKISTVKYVVDGQAVDVKSSTLSYNNINYAPVEPIVKAMGGNVTMDGNTVIVKTKAELYDERPVSTPDGITQIDVWQGKYYVAALYVKNKIIEKGYILSKDRKTKYYSIVKDGNVIIDDMPTTLTYGHDSFEYDYYVSTVSPLIN